MLSRVILRTSASPRPEPERKTYLFGDHYKLTASHSTSTPWLAKGCRMANDRRYILCSAIISRLLETKKVYPPHMLQYTGARIIVGFGPMDNLESSTSAYKY